MGSQRLHDMDHDSIWCLGAKKKNNINHSVTEIYVNHMLEKDMSMTFIRIRQDEDKTFFSFDK